MAKKVITQVEARHWRSETKKLRAFLNQLRRQWAKDWPEHCIFIGRADVDPATIAKVETAKRLRHAVVVAVDGQALTLWADPVQADSSTQG